MSTDNDIVLKVENLSKVYRLGEVGTGTISHDLNRWWAKIRGKEDPFSKVGSVNDRTATAQKGEYVKALSDINFEVKRGEVLGIIGKNGAGKSTLLKVISQITAPTTGSIKAKGRIASLLEVGTGMHPEMTGRENVYLNGTILGMTRREIAQKFDEIMDFAGCTKYADTPVKRYSSGMKVRLGFAVAAFLEPEILIVDEVLAVGDAEFQKKAIGKMQDISAGGGRTVLFVSHNMGSVKMLCSNCLLLKNGRIKNVGQSDQIVNEYITETDELQERHGLLQNSNAIKDSQFVIEEIYFFDRNKKAIKEVISGQFLQIDVIYSSIGQTHKNLDLVLGISIYDKEKRFITVLNNKMSQNQFQTDSRYGIINCTLEKLPLMSGIYYFTFSMQVNGRLEVRLDQIKSLLVHDGDYYGTKFINSHQRQGIYIDQKWSLEEGK